MKAWLLDDFGLDNLRLGEWGSPPRRPGGVHDIERGECCQSSRSHDK